MRTLLCAAVFGTIAQAQQAPANFLNIEPRDAPALAHAVGAEMFDIYGPSAKSSGSFTIVEANGKLSSETVERIRSSVQQGGVLILGFGRHPGPAASQLAFMLPTTAWSTNGEDVARPISLVPIASGAADKEIFPAAPTFELPYYFPMRPVSAVERGIARYDRYLDDSKDSFYEHPGGEFWWTRPLLNRDWRVRITANDRAASPLLITGLYGAGRVAVFASGLEGDGPQLQAMWTSTLQWLFLHEAIGGEPKGSPVTLTSAVVADGLRVTFTNASAVQINVQAIARILTWEQAFIGDSLQSVTIPASGTATLDIPLPKPGEMQYQALDFRRAFVVRLGVLSESGATLLSESVVPVDLLPATSITLSTDNLYNVPYPYPGAPGYEALPAWSNRMGTPLEQYAYLPASTVRAKVVFSNGVRNLAPLAHVTDETNPTNSSVMAINDGGARFNKGPRGGMEAYAMWTGKDHAENVLRFHFASPMTFTAITILGDPGDQKPRLGRNPGAVTVECDGKVALRSTGLDALFVSEDGLVRLAFSAPMRATEVVVRFPWMEMPAGKREAPSLGEIELEGAQSAFPPEVQGNATLVLRDAMSGRETVVSSKAITVPSGGHVEWAQGFKLPEANSTFYQLQVRFNGHTRTVPILAIQPTKTLTSITLAHPAHAPMENFVTTRGFTNLFPLGTGTREGQSPWENPDDLIWAYEHKVKQTNDVPRSWASWMYLTESDMRHYSTPWTLLPNGESVLAAGTPNIVEGMKKQGNWSSSANVNLGFGDRWDSGPSLPSLYDWPELVAFDQYLRDQHRPGLAGKTHAEINDDVNRNHAADWAIWHEHRYVANVEDLSKTFAALGKKMSISGQGVPMTSNADAAILAKTISGMNSDSTWGMDSESIPMTTGRQLAAEAINPEWKFGFNFVWGWDSAIINNVFWYGPVGTTEPSRRHYYDTAWRGIVGPDGAYQSSFTYGYGNNGGEAWTMAQNDYQQNWYAQERFSLLNPDRPVGAGLLVSSAVVDSPSSMLFSGGGMGPDGKSEALVHRIETAFARLHDAGVDIPFTANINAVRQWGSDTPFIVYDLAAASPQELAVIKALAGRGVRIAAFNASASPGATPAGDVGAYRLLADGGLLSIPFSADTLTPELALQLAPILEKFLRMPITFPAGTMGYSFASGPHTMIVLEDWLEQARELTLRVHATGATAHAVGLNDHNSLAVSRDGPDWLIRVPIRPGDGEVVVLDQTH